MIIFKLSSQALTFLFLLQTILCFLKEFVSSSFALGWGQAKKKDRKKKQTRLL